MEVKVDANLQRSRGDKQSKKAKRAGTSITEEKEAEQSDKKEEVGDVFIGKCRRERMRVGQ